MRIAQLLNCSIAKLLNRSNNGTMEQWNNDKSQHGFTLLELLVSISIIGVLISLASVSYSSAQKKSRDAKRQGDLKAMQNAMEQYYSSCGYVYPTAMPAAGSSFSCGTSTLIEKVPTDPKTGEAYPTGAAFDGIAYKICATTEVVPTPYCVSNLQ